MISLADALDQLRERSHSTSDQGTRFERLVQAALLADPVQKTQFKKIRSWKDWASLNDQDAHRQDTGIDLVAELSTAQGGGNVAIQCKFYEAGKSQISKQDIDSFLSASGRVFQDSQRRKHRFARRMIVTTLDRWTKHAEDAIRDQTIPVTRFDFNQLKNMQVDWKGLLTPSIVQPRRDPKALRPYQKEAVQKVCVAFDAGEERGRLIMACGTGKTLVGLRIAEKQVRPGGRVLVVMPSLSLLSQTLYEWVADSSRTLHTLAVCSDSQVHQRKKEDQQKEDISPVDMVIPPTTDSDRLANALRASHLGNGDGKPMTVVFATYQSLEVIQKAQQHNLLGNRPTPFDLVIADEAHRTAGTEKRIRSTDIKGSGDKETPLFTRIHDREFVTAQWRLYMTATPKVYGSTVTSKAKEEDLAIFSMDDDAVFGKELYRYSFSDAVKAGHLADYQVVVLGLYRDQKTKGILKKLLHETGDEDQQRDLPALVKMLGSWQAINNPQAGKNLGKDGKHKQNGSSVRLKRVLFFSGTIKASKYIEANFRGLADEANEANKYLSPDRCLTPQVRHVDGTMGALSRNKVLDWLRDEQTSEGECRIISNVRCLTEGIDVPALDGVVFFSPRKSQVDVVQAVGRVMRKTSKKELGYIILPVAVLPEEKPEQFLENSATYRHVWQVLAALRSHDERFEAKINQMEFTRKLPDNLKIVPPYDIGISDHQNEIGEHHEAGQLEQWPLNIGLTLEQWQNIITPRLVKNCGSRRYWSDWAEKIAEIAQGVSSEIEKQTDKDDRFGECFKSFLKGLQANIHPGVTSEQATEILAQHWITGPVFNALFENYQFSEKNAVSQNIDAIFREMTTRGMGENLEELQKFYQDVANRAAGIDTLEGRQNIMEKLYEDFFTKAFKKDADRLGIAYTPTQVVDFILKSADHVLQREFGRKISDTEVHVLDPFSGTGRFLVRLLANKDLIRDEDLERKYRHELHMNEIMLLPYYIGNVNVEQAYHSRRAEKQGAKEAEGYASFPGGVLADTFQMAEKPNRDLFRNALPLNSEQAKRQKETRLQVIVSNPPYSVGQKSANDANQNQAYPALAKRIQDTYVSQSKAQVKKSLYDSYILAIRWALDRVGEEGVVAFITNAGFINGKSSDGLRKHLRQECSAVYVLNLRGNANTQGEQRKKEKDGIFGQRSKVPTAILILVKQRNRKGAGTVYYHDIGDYLKLKDKLKWLQENSLMNISWQVLQPNEEGDWLDPRDPDFSHYLPLGDEGVKRSALKRRAPQDGLDLRNSKAQSLVSVFTNGVVSSRDAWAWNFSAQSLRKNMEQMIDFYNQEVARYSEQFAQKGSLAYEQVQAFVNQDAKLISWSRRLFQAVPKKHLASFSDEAIRTGMYRPFCQKYLYYESFYNEVLYKTQQCWPRPETINPALGVLGQGENQEFSVWATNLLPDFHLLSGAKWFPLHWWDNDNRQHSNISPAAIAHFQAGLDADRLSPEDLLHYAYGVLHHPDYRKRFKGNLCREMARLPCVADWQRFMQAGRDLMKLHIAYDKAEPYPLQRTENPKHPQDPTKRSARAGLSYIRYTDKKERKEVIINERIRLSGIPTETYNYKVGGKSLPDWVIRNCQKTTDKKSGIVSDATDFSENPDYFPDLFAKAVRVGIESSRIVAGLPELRILDTKK